MASFIQFRRSRRSSTASVYMQLLSALASDLDHKLSELCTTPPPPYDRLSDNELHSRSANTTASIGSEGLFARHDQTIAGSKTYSLDGSAFVSKDLFGNINKGAEIKFTDIPTDTKVSLSKTSNGLIGSATSTIFKNDKHWLEGSGTVQKLEPNILLTGGAVKYSHIPSDSSFAVSHKSAHGFGEKLGAEANYNFFKTNDGRGTIGIAGTYDRTRFPGGYTSNNYGGLLHGTYRFQ